MDYGTHCVLPRSNALPLELLAASLHDVGLTFCEVSIVATPSFPHKLNGLYVEGP